MNPNWKPLLDVLPEPLHAIVTPHLEAWDKGVQDKLQETRAEFEPYKFLKEQNINPQAVQQSLYLLSQFEQNPQEVVQRAIETFNLPYVDPATVQQQPTIEDEEDFEVDGDISKHPAFKQVMEQLEKMQGTLSEREQAEAQAAQQKEWDEWVATKKTEAGDFDEEYVAALVLQGLDGDAAIARYQEKFASSITVPNSQTEQVDPPIVMGGDGSGSGLPEQPLNFASMKKNEFEDTVTAMLQAAQSQDN